MDAADPILIEDLDGVVVEMNDEAERSYGWSRTQLVGSPIKNIVPPDRHDQADELLQRCKTGQAVRNIEGLRQTKDGHIVPVLLALSLIKGEGGQAEAIATLAKDITDQKLTEEEVRRMSKVFMDAADPILIEDLDGTVVEMNDEAELSYGWTREELVGTPIKTIVPPDRHDQADDLLRRCKAGDDVRNVEGLRLTKDGRIVPVLITVSLIKGEAGQAEAIATLAKDITDQKRAEMELRNSRDNLEEMIGERTTELEKNVRELETFNKFAVDRELRMIELKKDINALLARLGEPPKYEEIV